MTDKIVVDAKDMTLGEMAEIADVTQELDVENPGANFRYTAALAWMTKRRTDPAFTYEQALTLKMGDIEIVDHDPEVPAASNGGKPRSLLASGTSTLPT